MNKISYKNLELEDNLNIGLKLKSKKSKVENLIERSIILLMIIFTIHYLEIPILKLIFIIFWILAFLILSKKNIIICANIIRKFFKRNIKTIEFDEKNIKIYNGKYIVLDSYNNINTLIEYKNLIEIKYIPVDSKKYYNQIILIPKDVFETKNELFLFKELIISKITENNFTAYDNDFEITEINNFDKIKNKIYLLIFLILFIFILIFCFQYIINYILI